MYKVYVPETVRRAQEDLARLDSKPTPDELAAVWHEVTVVLDYGQGIEEGAAPYVEQRLAAGRSIEGQDLAY